MPLAFCSVCCLFLFIRFNFLFSLSFFRQFLNENSKFCFNKVSCFGWKRIKFCSSTDKEININWSNLITTLVLNEILCLCDWFWWTMIWTLLLILWAACLLVQKNSFKIAYQPGKRLDLGILYFFLSKFIISVQFFFYLGILIRSNPRLPNLPYLPLKSLFLHGNFYNCKFILRLIFVTITQNIKHKSIKFYWTYLDSGLYPKHAIGKAQNEQNINKYLAINNTKINLSQSQIK